MKQIILSIILIVLCTSMIASASKLTMETCADAGCTVSKDRFARGETIYMKITVLPPIKPKEKNLWDIGLKIPKNPGPPSTTEADILADKIVNGDSDVDYENLPENVGMTVENLKTRRTALFLHGIIVKDPQYLGPVEPGTYYDQYTIPLGGDGTERWVMLAYTLNNNNNTIISISRPKWIEIVEPVAEFPSGAMFSVAFCAVIYLGMRGRFG